MQQSSLNGAFYQQGHLTFDNFSTGDTLIKSYAQMPLRFVQHIEDQQIRLQSGSVSNQKNLLIIASKLDSRCQHVRCIKLIITEGNTSIKK
ncbi:hypothetical protein CEXT_363421 [Caerostris extrusa]|uniref:Uncharacterized protein n=1 Tax=Caerostris extrusa TaxID=172846 RepID=A0AAV4SWR2_CAEEX|nr:hypothetical protein CEXT_363421 [Caerostris extrusa]